MGPPLSRGRRCAVARGEDVLLLAGKERITRPFLVLSTCARGGPACPSSDGEARRCCLLRRRAPAPSPVRRRRHFRCGAARRVWTSATCVRTFPCCGRHALSARRTPVCLRWGL